MIEAVIFDMDGLLVDSEPFWKVAEIKCFQTVGIELDVEMCKQTMGMRIDEVVDYWYEKQPWENKSKATLVNEIIDEMDHLLATQGAPMKGVEQIFSLCRELGLKMALASSSSMRLIKTVVKRLELENDLEVIRSAETEEYGKPHPAVFIQTALDLEVAPEKCLVLEDSFFGVVAALAAKMKVIAVPDQEDFLKEQFVVAHQKVKSLDEITPQLLKNI